MTLGWSAPIRRRGSAILVGRIATIYYFLHFLVILPLLARLERPKPLPASISQPVLSGGYAPAPARMMDKA